MDEISQSSLFLKTLFSANNYIFLPFLYWEQARRERKPATFVAPFLPKFRLGDPEEQALTLPYARRNYKSR